MLVELSWTKSKPGWTPFFHEKIGEYPVDGCDTKHSCKAKPTLSKTFPNKTNFSVSPRVRSSSSKRVRFETPLLGRKNASKYTTACKKTLQSWFCHKEHLKRTPEGRSAAIHRRSGIRGYLICHSLVEVVMRRGMCLLSAACISRLEKCTELKEIRVPATDVCSFACWFYPPGARQNCNRTVHVVFCERRSTVLFTCWEYRCVTNSMLKFENAKITV